MKALSTLCLVAVFAFFAGCKSELKDTLPTSPTDAQLPHTHTSGFITPSAPDFHGTQLIVNGFDVTLCQKCHGTNLDGGIAKRSCTGAGCHTSTPGKHPDGFKDKTNAAFHGKLLASTFYAMGDCAKCHGGDFAGGAAKKSCSNSGCHTAADGGPTACYTCHGDAATKKVSPKGSEAHDVHLDGGDFSALKMNCASCHTVPAAWNSPGHIPTTLPMRAVVNVTDAMASISTIGGTKAAPTYDPATKTCANVYCHGNFTNGNHFAPKFDGTEQNKCGTCHGNATTGNPLPGGTHFQVATCSVCHTGVIDANNLIIDKAKHMNGKLDVYGAQKTDW